MEREKPSGPVRNPASAQASGNPDVNAGTDAFLARLKQEMRPPKPGQDDVDAVIQAVRNMTLEAEAETAMVSGNQGLAGDVCAVCGNSNAAGNKFCSTCGVPLEEASNETPTPKPVPGQHHYHHHYHHHYIAPGEGVPQIAASEPRASASNPALRDVARMRAGQGGAAISRAETAVRQATQDWAFACNTKHLEDLVSLYATDAIVLRPNVTAIRGAAAIREFFVSLLDSGFGDVEIDPLRVEIIGDVAYDAGRCKMLVPVAVGKRREERGKYLIVYSRSSGGEWKIVSDCWSSDLSLK